MVRPWDRAGGRTQRHFLLGLFVVCLAVRSSDAQGCEQACLATDGAGTTPVCGLVGKGGRIFASPCLAACAGAKVVDMSKCPMGAVATVDNSTCLCAPGGDPVCGMSPDGNRVTYDNMCNAKCAQAINIRKGICPCPCPKSYMPVCGSDSKTYDNDCLATCAGVTFTDGACPCACPRDYNPVCGSDLKTYDNACLATCQGVTFSLGKCVVCACTKELNPVCGSNGKTYNNPCLAKCDGVTFTDGDCPDTCDVAACPTTYDPVCATMADGTKQELNNTCVAECTKDAASWVPGICHSECAADACTGAEQKPVCATTRGFIPTQTFASACEARCDPIVLSFVDGACAPLARACDADCSEDNTPVCVTWADGTTEEFANDCARLACSPKNKEWATVARGICHSECVADACKDVEPSPVCASTRGIVATQTFSSECEARCDPIVLSFVAGECPPPPKPCGADCPDVNAPVCALVDGSEEEFSSACVMTDCTTGQTVDSVKEGICHTDCATNPCDESAGAEPVCAATRGVVPFQTFTSECAARCDENVISFTPGDCPAAPVTCESECFVSDTNTTVCATLPDGSKQEFQNSCFAVCKKARSYLEGSCPPPLSKSCTDCNGAIFEPVCATLKDNTTQTFSSICLANCNPDVVSVQEGGPCPCYRKCSLTKSPVCGVESGETYANSCFAICAGVTYTDGPCRDCSAVRCRSGPPVCATMKPDGSMETIQNECLASCNPKVYSWAEGECRTSAGGSNGGSGDCVCAQIFSPVCATFKDGSKKSFPNACMAACDKSVVATDGGACPCNEVCPTDTQQYVCGNETGDTYDNACQADCLGVTYTPGECKSCKLVRCRTGPPVCATMKPDGHLETLQSECLANCNAKVASFVPGACPVACTKEYVPVCGDDGVTYDNKCLAEAANVTYTQGECTPPVACNTDYYPVCGSDGVTYANKCLAKVAKVMFTEGECSPVKPAKCTKQFVPVCGSDGNTYPNACLAKAANVTYTDGQCTVDCTSIACPMGGAGVCAVMEDGSRQTFLNGCLAGCDPKVVVYTDSGPCEPPVACTKEYVPVCGDDGVTYDNKCLAGVANVTFTDGPCGNMTRCTMEYAPVCGSDGITYSNKCMAMAAGIDLFTAGECQSIAAGSSGGRRLKNCSNVRCMSGPAVCATFANNTKMTLDNECIAGCTDNVKSWVTGRCLSSSGGAAGNSTGSGSGNGTVIGPMCKCPKLYAPVCATLVDNTTKTFPNNCMAVCDKTVVLVQEGGPCPCNKMCTARYEPVCGVEDGKTYSNACKAECVGVSWTPGECKVDCSAVTCPVDGPGVCAILKDGTNQTFANSCLAKCDPKVAGFSESGPCAGGNVKASEACIHMCGDLVDLKDPICLLSPKRNSSTTYINPCVAQCKGKADPAHALYYSGVCRFACDETCPKPKSDERVCCPNGREYPSKCYAQCVNNVKPADLDKCSPGYCTGNRAVKLAQRRSPKCSAACFAEPCSVSKPCNATNAVCVSTTCPKFFRFQPLQTCSANWVDLSTGKLVVCGGGGGGGGGGKNGTLTCRMESQRCTLDNAPLLPGKFAAEKCCSGGFCKRNFNDTDPITSNIFGSCVPEEQCVATMQRCTLPNAPLLPGVLVPIPCCDKSEECWAPPFNPEDPVVGQIYGVCKPPPPPVTGAECIKETGSCTLDFSPLLNGSYTPLKCCDGQFCRANFSNPDPILSRVLGTCVKTQQCVTGAERCTLPNPPLLPGVLVPIPCCDKTKVCRAAPFDPTDPIVGVIYGKCEDPNKKYPPTPSKGGGMVGTPKPDTCAKDGAQCLLPNAPLNPATTTPLPCCNSTKVCVAPPLDPNNPIVGVIYGTCQDGPVDKPTTPAQNATCAANNARCLLDNPPLAPGSYTPFPCCDKSKVCYAPPFDPNNPIVGVIYGTCIDPTPPPPEPTCAAKGERCMLDNPPLTPGSYTPYPCCDETQSCWAPGMPGDEIVGRIYGVCANVTKPPLVGIPPACATDGEQCVLDDPPLEPGSFIPFPCCNQTKVCRAHSNPGNPILGAIYGKCEDFVCSAMGSPCTLDGALLPEGEAVVPCCKGAGVCAAMGPIMLGQWKGMCMDPTGPMPLGRRMLH